MVQDVEAYEREARDWVDSFCHIYHRDRVTPYIHCMYAHVGQFLRLHGSLLPFTQQGLEKYNDRLSKVYYRFVVCCYVYITILHYSSLQSDEPAAWLCPRPSDGEGKQARAPCR